jgi:hypothetical protein
LFGGVVRLVALEASVSSAAGDRPPQHLASAENRRPGRDGSRILVNFIGASREAGGGKGDDGSNPGQI